MAADFDARSCLLDVLVRIAHETGVTKLTAHGWKQDFEGAIRWRCDHVLQRILGG